MKLNTVNDEIVSNGVLSESQFTIKASPKAFKILSSSLYKNKIQAIIRELSCNAYDSHVHAKKPDIPFHVKLPTKIDQNFKIRDYGTGLSHDDVMVLYTTYFNSTKTDSNDYIGALGLGSKSPFSYTSSFIVTSYHDGMKRSYSAYLDNNGMPSIALLLAIETKQESGLEIEFSVNESDNYTFKNEARIVFTHFVVKPKILNEENIAYPEHDISLEYDNWQILENGIFSPKAIQGNICYPISFESIKNLPKKLEYLKTVKIVIKFPIGSLDIAASREELSYDNKTCEILIVKLNEIHEYIIKSIQDRIDSAKSLWYAKSVMNDIIYYNHNIYHEKIVVDNNINSFFYKGKKLSSGVKHKEMPKSDNYDMYNVFLIQSNLKRNLNNRVFTERADTAIIINDLKIRFRPRLLKFFQDSKFNTVYEFKMSDDSEQKDIDELIEFLGNPDYIKMSDLPLPKTDKINNKAELKIQKLRNVSGEFKSYVINDIKKFENNPSQNTAYYIDMYNGKPLHKHINNQNLRIIVKKAIDAKIISIEDDIFGMNKGIRKKLNIDNFVNLFDHIENYIKNDNVIDDLEVYHNSKIQNYERLGFTSYIYYHAEEILKDTIVEDPIYRTMLSDISNIKNTPQNIINIYELCEILNLDLGHKKLTHKSKIFDKVYDRYPLLCNVKYHKGSYQEEKNYKDYELYIKAVYENRYKND